MQRSKFAAKGQASLFSFGIGQLGVDGRVSIPESHNKEQSPWKKDKTHVGPILPSPKEFEPGSVNI